jgi:tRNA A-37 threonylcarbamoyl transferase component Bud32/predicted nucleotidyltransferase
MARAAKGRKVAAACAYGSRVAGYARPDSDIDLLVVLEDYPYKVKYTYMQESGVHVSALVVDKKSLEKDAAKAYLAEFVAGRLLHVYEPLTGSELLEQVERAYKGRVILEELHNLVRISGVLATEIWFPLEYVVFSKVLRRAVLYPGAAYSYYKIYASGGRNLLVALEGYRRALADIVSKDAGLVEKEGDRFRISEKRIKVAGGEPSLRLAKHLQEFSSYFVHTYAGRKMFHLFAAEAESKIRRHMREPFHFPPFMSCPACEYLHLPEGLLVADSRRQDWLEMVAQQHGIPTYDAVKRRLGNANSRTMLYSLRHEKGELWLAAKDMSKSKSVKWAALSLWTGHVKKFRVDPLMRLGYEYRALRRLRAMGLNTPEIEAVVLDRRVLITRFIEGKSLAGVIKDAVAGRGDASLVRTTGEQISRVHAAGHAFGNIKPKNVIAGEGLYFTDLDQFVFEGGDPAWDVAQFLSWGLKGTGNAKAAAKVTKEFLAGYADNIVIKKLARSKHYIETFYPVLAPLVAQAIKNEMKKF